MPNNPNLPFMNNHSPFERNANIINGPTASTTANKGSMGDTATTSRPYGRPSSGPMNPNVQDQEKVKQVHDQVNEVVLIMRENIDKVMERGTGLETLQAQSDELSQGAQNFHRSAVRVRRTIWWKNVKFQIIAVVLILGLIAIAYYAYQQRHVVADVISTDPSVPKAAATKRLRDVDAEDENQAVEEDQEQVEEGDEEEEDEEDEEDEEGDDDAETQVDDATLTTKPIVDPKAKQVPDAKANSSPSTKNKPKKSGFFGFLS